MRPKIAHISLVVGDYDEAIAFYLEKLDFKLIEDKGLSESKRWVLIAPSDTEGCSLLLAKRQTRGRLLVSVINPAEEYFSFCSQMFSG